MIWQNEIHVLSNSKSWSFFKKLKRGNSHSFSTIQSPIQSHTWIELNPHSYLLTFWAWSNIVAFREMLWSSSTLVIHYARSSIKSIKSGSPEALHPPKKRRKSQKRMSQQSYSSKKKEKKDKMAKMEKPKSNTTQRDIHPSHTHAHDQVLKDDMISQRQDLWSCKINEEDMQVYPYLGPHKSLFKHGRGFL